MHLCAEEILLCRYLFDTACQVGIYLILKYSEEIVYVLVSQMTI